MLKHGVFFSLQNIWNIVFDLTWTSFTFFICQTFDIDIFSLVLLKKLFLFVFNSKGLTKQLCMIGNHKSDNLFSAFTAKINTAN